MSVHDASSSVAGAVPEELALSAQVELGAASLADVQAFVDRRLLAAERATPALLALCDLGQRSPVDIASALEALSPITSDETRAAWLAVATVEACESGLVSLEGAVAYLLRIVDRLGAHASEVYGLDDALAFATDGTWGTRQEVLEELHDLGRRVRLAQG